MPYTYGDTTGNRPNGNPCFLPAGGFFLQPMKTSGASCLLNDIFKNVDPTEKLKPSSAFAYLFSIQPYQI
jgi:hypothetical protein